MKHRCCGNKGCNKIIPYEEFYCERHKIVKKKEVKEQRERLGRSTFYNLRVWRRLSIDIRTKQPICVCCNQNLSVLVDHIVELQDISKSREKEMGLNRDNLQPLCTECHNRKTAIIAQARDSNTLELEYAKYFTELGMRDPRR